MGSTRGATRARARAHRSRRRAPSPPAPYFPGLTSRAPRHESPVLEPGLDEHQWVTEWEAIDPLLTESPTEALSEADDLVGRMMEARGFPLEEREGEDAKEPETVR